MVTVGGGDSRYVADDVKTDREQNTVDVETDREHRQHKEQKRKADIRTRR